MAPPYNNLHVGPFFSMAPENQNGEKKHHPLRCRSLGFAQSDSANEAAYH
jgi:hypothetical protein